MKKKRYGWIVPLIPAWRKYKIHDVTYVVSSRFEPFESENTVHSRFRDVISNDMIDLQKLTSSATMEEECVYSAAEKED